MAGAWGETRRRNVALAIVLGIVLTAGFFGVGRAAVGRPLHDVSIPLDERIPLRPGWVWAYLLYYPFCFLPLIFSRVLDDRALFRRVALGFLLQFLPAWAVFYLYPAAIGHPLVPGDSPSAMALRGIYAVDAGTNIFPSLHVANVFYVSLLSTRFLPFFPWPALFFALAALISISTLFCKQHFVADLPAGALLGMAAYRLAFRKRS